MQIMTLNDMLAQLRAEARISPNVAHGAHLTDGHIAMLARVQSDLYSAYDWPMLKLTETTTVLGGERYRTYPENFDFEGIEDVYAHGPNGWHTLAYGIGIEQLNHTDSDAGERGDTIHKWQHYLSPQAETLNQNMFEVWPVPKENVNLRFYGKRKLYPLSNPDTDRSTIDGPLVVLYAAAEILAGQKAEDATLKLQKAQQRMDFIKRRQNAAGDTRVNMARPRARAVPHFKLGMDLRKSATAAEPGSLRVLKNAYITAGGEIEKRKTMTSIGVLPQGITKGLAFQGTNLVVFGTVTTQEASPLPANVAYHQLIPVDSAQLVDVLDVQNYGASLYVVAKMNDGSVRHFFNNNEVTDANAKGTNVRAHKRKIYAVDGVNLRFSGISTPTDWTNGTGAGVIDASTEDATSTDLVGLEQYYSYLAVMARTFIQIWGIDPDPAQNTQLQTLNNIGLVAPNAAASYGNGDVLFLSDTGIRSIRARDASNAAVLNDIGSPVDAYIQAKRATLTPDEAQKIKALVDPLTGHFWMIWGHEAFVLSLYPNAKVTAWSIFDFSTDVEEIVNANSRLAIRRGDELFVYGSVAPTGSPFDPNTPIGTSAALYDNTSVEIETPFLDAQRPATKKRWTGLDLTCQGNWEVYVNPDPTVPGTWVKVATVTRDTWNEGRIPLDFTSTHLAVRLVSQGTGIAKLATMALHFDGGEES
ncbi:hypothetical protein ADUPG1_006327 [Aduncisulcus paluster]|uniref:Virion structural protein n=1 Tax=Aduncisulcus paluster TaxID=2918883 RepID=A0ABQ5KJH5_9EUKA|nr:hypothetical protein ADUPG1_006327 [Aduncisulcus paluster]